MSGDIFDYSNLEGRVATGDYVPGPDAAKHPQCTGLLLTTKSYLAQIVNHTAIDRPGINEVFLKTWYMYNLS